MKKEDNKVKRKLIIIAAALAAMLSLAACGPDNYVKQLPGITETVTGS